MDRPVFRVKASRPCDAGVEGRPAVRRGGRGRDGDRPGPLAEEEPAAGLPLAGERTAGPSRTRSPPRWQSPGRGADVGRRDDQATLLKVAQRGAGAAQDEEGAREQAPPGTVGRRAAADHREARGVQLGGQLRTRVAVDLDDCVPGTGEPGDQQPLAFDTFEPDVRLAQVQPPDELGVDLMVVAQLGDHDRGRPARARPRSLATAGPGDLGRQAGPRPARPPAGPRRLEKSVVIGNQVMVRRGVLGEEVLERGDPGDQVLRRALSWPVGARTRSSAADHRLDLVEDLLDLARGAAAAGRAAGRCPAPPCWPSNA